MQSYIAGKSPLLYVILWGFYLFLFVSILSFSQAGGSNPVIGVLYFILFGIHEASHLLLGYMPALIAASSGSLSELLFTSVVAFVAFRAKAYYAGIFGLLWFMLAAKSAGNYMADARSQALPLVGPSPTVHHDWNTTFGILGWLDADTAIGGVVTWLGIIAGVIGLALGLWLIAQMWLVTPDKK